MGRYLFTSERLGFRSWEMHDIAAMAAINADPQVMEFFPTTQDMQQTEAFVMRMQQQMTEKRYCYFAVEKLDDHAFIGFIGLSDKTFEAAFTPCVDVGWRLARSAWGHGYATEGAKRCLEYGLHELGLREIYAIAPLINIKSEGVMKKIGMNKVCEFVHPQLPGDKRLRDCVVYVLLREEAGYTV
jgi:RimJ/RimL family protein N-acetyltransferase